jgi:hypothetical protein
VPINLAEINRTTLAQEPIPPPLFDPQLECSRLPLLAAALTPSTWRIHKYFSPTVCNRVLECLRIEVDRVRAPTGNGAPATPPAPAVPPPGVGSSLLEKASRTQQQRLLAAAHSTDAAPAVRFRDSRLFSNAFEALTGDIEWGFYLSFVASDEYVDDTEEEFWMRSIVAEKLPSFKRLCLRLLGAPASSASVERLFSTVKRVVADTRHSLRPHVVQAQSLLMQNAPRLRRMGIYDWAATPATAYEEEEDHEEEEPKAQEEDAMELV